MQRNQRPSLELAYERTKDVLLEQAALGDSLSTKATFFWVAATALFGLIFPIGVGKTNGHIDVWGNLVPLGFAMVFYAAITGLNWFVVFPRRQYGIISPAILRDDFTKLNQEKFMVDMITHTVAAHEANERMLGRRAWFVRWGAILAFLEFCFLVWWLCTL